MSPDQIYGFAYGVAFCGILDGLHHGKAWWVLGWCIYAAMASVARRLAEARP